MFSHDPIIQRISREMHTFKWVPVAWLSEKWGVDVEDWLQATTREKRQAYGFDAKVLDEFKRVGGTELAPMSTSASKAVAFSYAQSDTPLVFKYECKGLTRGCSIDFLSVYPGEEEYLYPPLTYICYKSCEIIEGVTVISVEPQKA